ncbi:MAG: hypothetical protein PWP24_236 [Clostridiales bacterium]|nr:hypothetical protein [Clostridiales bacterium]
MNIIHNPNRINPYQAGNYGREPEWITTEDFVEIRCYADQMAGHEEPLWLSYQVNGGEPIQQKGTVFLQEEEKTYYQFVIGPFAVFDQVSYTFFCEGEAILANTYRFEVLKEECISKPKKVWMTKENEGEMIASYSLGDQVIALRFEFSLEGILVKTQVSEEDIRNHGAITTFLHKKEITKEKYRLFYEEEIGLFLYNQRGEQIGSFRFGEHTIRLLRTAAYEIRDLCITLELGGEAFYGFGEKFDRVNQRGLSPKNCVVEKFTHQGDKTYLPIPFFLTERGYGVFYDTDHMVDFTIQEGMKDKNQVTLRTKRSGSKVGADEIHFIFGSMKEQLSTYIKKTGGLELPPDWVFGPWMSANGWDNQAETLLQVENMKKYQIPATVLVLEAWSDEATFYVFNDAVYEAKEGMEAHSYAEYTYPKEGRWPDPKGMVDALHENGLKLLLWQIPIIKQFGEGEAPTQHKRDEEVAINRGYCIKKADGSPYRICDNWFAGSLLLDFTNDEAVDWWFRKRDYLVTELGVDGFKTDGGEFIYDYQAQAKDGRDGYAMKNPYPNTYVGAYYRFLERTRGKREGITFSRAGYTGAGRFPTHWAGDQVSDFSELRAQVKAGLSAGLSGIFFWGFDLAGFAGDLPTSELYLRAAAVAAFSPIMQFHAEPRSGQFGDDRRRSANNDRTPWNIAAVNADESVLTAYRYFANLRMNLLPYIISEAKASVEEYRPLFCHLSYAYEMDEKVYDIEDTYLFGRSLLVAPILNEGDTKREVYLPKGIWCDFFTGERYVGETSYHLSCPVGKILVFAKEGSRIPLHLPEGKPLGTYVGNEVNVPGDTCYFIYEEGEVKREY